MRCSWTGNTCWMMPRAANSGTVGGQEQVSPILLPVPGLASPLPWPKPKSQFFPSFKSSEALPRGGVLSGQNIWFSFRIWEVQRQAGWGVGAGIHVGGWGHSVEPYF